MEDTPPGPRPLLIRQGSRPCQDEQEQQDLLTPLVQSRRPSRQYVSISPPPCDSLTLTKGCPQTLPAFTNPWSAHGGPSSSGIRLSPGPRVWLAPHEEAGPCALGARGVDARAESAHAGGASLSVVAEDGVRLPLTPWMSNSDRECGLACEAGGCCCDDGVTRRGVVHATVLAAQFVAFVGLFCVWVDVAVREAGSDAGFWYRLWAYFQPVVGVLGLFAVAMMLVWEVSGLSEGVFLGAQAVVLVVGGGAGFCVVWWAFEQSSRVVIGTAVGTAVMMLGVGMLGFVRAAVVWWLES